MDGEDWTMDDEEMDANMVFEEESWGEFMIELDFEFDAPKYVDLSKEEPVMQATLAEKWFDTAKSDPPTPDRTNTLRQLGILYEDDDANNNLGKNSKSNDAIQGIKIAKA